MNGPRSTPASTLVCSGCGSMPAAGDPYPFRCPNSAAGDVDHVLKRVLDTSRLEFPDATSAGEPEPFVRYRSLLNSYHRATSGGLSDETFVELVRDIDSELSRVEGHGFAVTPFERSEVLSRRLGFEDGAGVWIKDETGNVAGSHKARHLMGVLLHLEVAELLGLADRSRRPDLAVASCGNAALAAAALAAAVGRRLEVFVPVDADSRIVGRLDELGAEIRTCPRVPGARGDPTYARLLEELAKGALAFTCQGNLNGLTIEGGETLGYEIVSKLLSVGAELDHLVVQVGGGALASSCVQALSEAADLGALRRMPRLHTVQTAAVHPLERAYHRLREELEGSPSRHAVEEHVHRAAARRSSYMWPWEAEPKSIATGILDDETYDWLAVVQGMLVTGGRPVVVGEDRLEEAHELGRETHIPVDPTGSSSLAGLLELIEAGVVAPGQRVAVLFTGVER